MTEYTEEEARTFRTAVFGAMVLVSTAEPGSLDQESRAGGRAMEHLSPELREVLKAGRPVLPAGSVSDVEDGVLFALRRSVEILAAKAPHEAEAFPAAVVAICREVAEADGQVAAAEGAVVAKVEAALTR
jgi:tellurite resistance protein